MTKMKKIKKYHDHTAYSRPAKILTASYSASGIASSLIPSVLTVLQVI